MGSSETVAGRWATKFKHAFRGVRAGVWGQSSFLVHLPVAVVVVLSAAWLRCSLCEWGLLLLCITCVVAFELFNSSVECLARAISTERNAELADALDIASGAVLIAALGASLVGLLILGNRFMQWAQATG